MIQILGFKENLKNIRCLQGVMKRAVKWTSTDVDGHRPSTIDQVEKSRMVDIERERVCGVVVDRQRSTLTK